MNPSHEATPLPQNASREDAYPHEARCHPSGEQGKRVLLLDLKRRANDSERRFRDLLKVAVTSRSRGWLPMLLLAWHLSVVAAQGQKSATTNLPTLTHAEQIREMSMEEAGRGYPVRIRGVVTYYNWDLSDLFIQDSTAGIWVSVGQTKFVLHHGEFVEVEGFSGVGDLAPEIEHPHFRNLGEAPMPNPQRPTSDELASGRLDSQWIELEAVVRSVAEREGGLVLNVSAGAFECSVFVLKYPSVPTDIVDGQARIRGVFAGLYDPNSVRVIGFQVLTPSWSDVKVLQRPTQGPWSVPMRPIRWLLRLTPEGGFAHRVRVHGVVTYQQLGRFLCLRDSGGALLVNSTQPTSLKVGDLIDATGYPDIGAYTVVMRDAILQRVGGGPAPEPVAASLEELRAGRHDADLVRLSARLLNCTTRPGEKVLELQAEGVTFRATLYTGTNSSPLSLLRAGSLLQLTGVSMIEADENGQAKGFGILLRSPADVVVLKLPSWWTVGRIAWLLIMLAGIVFLISLWVAVLRRRVEERTETIRATLESTADGILVVSSAFKIVAYNHKFVEMWRIPEPVLASRDNNVLLNFVLSQLKDPDAFLTRIRQTHADHGTQTDDVIEFKDGRAFEHHSEPQRAWGRIIGRVWGFRDVTERRRAEEDLHHSRQMLRVVLDNIPQRVFWKDRNFNYLGCNRPCALDAGLQSPEEIIGKNDFELSWRETADLYRADDTLVMEQGSPKLNFEEPEKKPDGSSMWLRTSKLPLRDREGKVIGVIGTYEDITERKRAEKALRESEAELREALLAAQMGVWRWSPETDTVTWSEELYRIAGRDPKLPAPSLKEHPHVFAPESWEKLKTAVECTLATGTPYALDLELLRPDGSKRWVTGRGEALRDASGHITQLRGTVQDITERKQAEEMLVEYEKAVEGSQDMIAVVDREYRYLIANQAFLNQRGAEKGKVVGQLVADVLGHEAFERVVKNKLDECFQGKIVQYEMKYGYSRLGERDLSVTYFPIQGAAGIDRVAGVMQDITERKRAEEALRESGDRYRDLVEYSQDLICTHDLEGRILSINVAPARSLGYERSDLLKMHVQDILAPEVREEFSEYVAVLRRDGAAKGLMLVQTATGERRILEYNNTLRAEGVPTPIVRAMARDVTERKRAEEKLRESEARYRGLFENSLEGIGFSEGNKVLNANRALLDIFGYGDLEEFKAVPLLEHVAPESRDAIKELMGKINRGEPYPRRFEYQIIRKNGEIRDLEISTDVVCAAGQRYFQSTFRDITERKRAQQELERSLEQLRALAARLQNVREEERKLLAREIHDQLGQALTAIKIDLFALVCKIGGDPQHPPQGVSTLLRLVDETIKRVRQIATELRPGILDDLGLVAAIEWAGEDFEARTGIKCRLDLPQENIAVNPERATAIFRILQESLTNVVRHAAASEVKIRLGEKDKELILLVQDNGKGMRMDELSRSKSLGILGMHERALVFGGEVIIRATPGKGTTVRVRIPQTCLT